MKQCIYKKCPYQSVSPNIIWVVEKVCDSRLRHKRPVERREWRCCVIKWRRIRDPSTTASQFGNPGGFFRLTLRQTWRVEQAGACFGALVLIGSGFKLDNIGLKLGWDCRGHCKHKAEKCASAQTCRTSSGDNNLRKVSRSTLLSNMSTDRLLTTVLGAYQRIHGPEQTNRIISSTTSLLTTLSNPLNVTLLTSQLLTAPAIWNQADGLRTSLRIISIFNTAAITVRQHELDRSGGTISSTGGIGSDDWARAVIKGADDKSPRWRHLLVICGVLLGMEGEERRGLSTGLRSTIEGAMVTAANLALENLGHGGILGAEAIVLALNHAFPLLSDGLRRVLNYDTLGPIMLHAMVGIEGYQEGFFLGAIDMDVRQADASKFDWSPKSPSFLQVQNLASKPLVSSMGPLSKLIAHSLENMSDARRVSVLIYDLLHFTDLISTQWRRNKLSEIDHSEESAYLTLETSRVTLPALWQVLKTAMFATVIILRAVISRVLIDPVLASAALAPQVATQALLILRNIYFISSRQGANAFSAYTFVSLTSIDILSQFPKESREFLYSIRPKEAGQIPKNPLDRCLDLYFLNTSEHFSLVLNPQDNEALIFASASPYLNPDANRRLLEIFEAAHSAVLAVLAAPHNADLTAKVMPFYTEALLNSFPTNLSPRQFRFAFKTLMQISTPPAPLAASQPLLSDILLELLRFRAVHAPATPLPPALTLKSDADTPANKDEILLSEQAVLMLTLIDVLPLLPVSSLEEWLPLAADLLNAIGDNPMREVCKARFWDVLQNGEMDVDRAAASVAWWSSRGGREMVLHGGERQTEHGAFMSGGLGLKDGSHL
jgi:hypothetical protein